MRSIYIHIHTYIYTHIFIHIYINMYIPKSNSSLSSRSLLEVNLTPILHTKSCDMNPSHVSWLIHITPIFRTESRMSHIWMSHVTNMNSHVTYTNESWHTYRWIISHTHITPIFRPESSDRTQSYLCHDSFDVWEVMHKSHYQWVMSHTWMSHNTHIPHSNHTSKSHVSRVNESCHTYEWVM